MKEVREVLDQGTTQITRGGVDFTDPVLVRRKKKGVTLRSESAKFRENEPGKRGFRGMDCRDLVREPRRRNRRPPDLETRGLEEAKGQEKAKEEEIYLM